ncbi:hypothetical protein BKA61DRAFT_490931, partial [Leptodontidium sp. MPI-SDFR-AT-0119]
VFRLVNDERISFRKLTLCFLNLLKYSTSTNEGFADATIRSSTGCNINGFPVGTGWDPASGWGTPVRVVCDDTRGH